MSQSFTSSLAWLSDLGPIFGGSPDLVLEPRADDSDVPAIGYPKDFPAVHHLTISPGGPGDGWVEQIGARVRAVFDPADPDFPMLRWVLDSN